MYSSRLYPPTMWLSRECRTLFGVLAALLFAFTGCENAVGPGASPTFIQGAEIEDQRYTVGTAITPLPLLQPATALRR